MLFQGLSGGGRELSTREQKGCDRRHDWQADSEHGEIDGGHVTERPEVAAVPGEQGSTGLGGADGRAKQCEGAGGRDGNRAAGGAARPVFAKPLPSFAL